MVVAGNVDGVHSEGETGEETGLRGRVRRSWPMWLVALSLNGFFVYLTVLDAADVTPTRTTTGVYYGALCAALLAAAWHRRGIVLARLRSPRRLVVAFVAAGTVLSGWFVLNTALLSDGALATRLAGVLVLWSIPTALVAASLRRSDLPTLAQGLIALSLGFVAIEIVALARAGTEVFRFSPIANLDPISAGVIPAIGSIAALSFWPVARRGRALRFVAVIILVAAAAAPGSRGPVIALVFGMVALALVQQRRRVRAIVAGALTLGLALGLLVASHIGSFEHFASADPFDRTIRISSLSIRRQWLEDAIRDTPDRPIFGHGVGMLVDKTPEAALMGVSGQHTYPHNTLVEAAYSLGAVGLVAYLVCVGSALLALVSVVRGGGRDPTVAFALAFGVFAFVNTNVSGEIGEDALLWTSAVIAVALYADSRRSTVAAT